MLYDILKETRAFQDLAREGRLEGLEKGRQEGLEKGREEGLKEGVKEGVENARLAVLEVIGARFADPALVGLASVGVAAIDDLETLRHLVVKLAMVQKAEDVTPLLTQFTASAPKSSPVRKRTT